MRSRVGHVLVICLLVGTMAGAGVAFGPATAAGQPALATPGPQQTGTAAPDLTRIGVDVAENGTATWRVEFRFELADNESQTAFEGLRTELQQNPQPYVDRFETRLATTAEAASNATGRPMAIENLTVSVTEEALPTAYGVVTYEFTWTNFAAQSGQQLVVGDAISGLLLESDARLTVRWPESFEATAVDPTPDQRSDNAAVWVGSETTFANDQPRVMLAPTKTGPSYALFGGLGVVVLLAGIGAWWVLIRKPWEDNTTTTDETMVSTDDGGGDDTVDPELLSNEERVLRLLEANGGRMKQQQIVQETGWTDAKTSQVITGMRETGDVEVFRIGRENVVALPEATDV